jgi:hypothetical protein
VSQPDKTEIWWCEIQLWPFVLRIEAEVLLEQRPLRPGMRYYQCVQNDLVWMFWKLWDRLR